MYMGIDIDIVLKVKEIRIMNYDANVRFHFCSFQSLISGLLKIVNYFSFQIVDEKSNEAAIVDPVAPETVLAAVKDENVKLTTVLTTHHHWYEKESNTYRGKYVIF